MSRSVPLVLLVLLLGAVSAAGDPAEQFARANRLYEEGRFAEAAATYTALVDGGLASPALYFNLGNALLKSGELGESIVYYERARRLAPRAGDVRANLAYARGLVADVVPEAEGSAFLAALVRLKDAVSAEEALRVAAAAFWLAAAAAAAGRLVPRRRRLAQAVAAGGLMALVLAGSLAAIKVHEAAARERAVVVLGEVPVRSGPGDSYTARFSLHEGTEVDVNREAGGWCEIELTESLSGWVPRSALMDL